jgi:CubicO group peptidase (beta-lactamase class C family)
VTTTRGALALLLVLSASARHAPPPSPREADPEAFLDILESLRREARIPGLSVAVVRDRKVVLAEGLGEADPERKVRATAETAYDIASVSKPLSAVVALRLVESGALHLDRPLAEYSNWKEFCREFSGQPSQFARDLRCEPATHTLRHLLSHTAAGRPGAKFSYNPILYSWASRPMMAVTGAAFSSLVDRYVFGPAKMTRSARRHRDLPLPHALAQSLAPPHRIDGSGAVVRAPALEPQGDGAAGGIVSTAVDLAKFDVALDEGTLIAPASSKEMMTPARSSDGEALPYGLGWYVQEYRGQTLVWHSGWWENAYSALYLKVPQRALTLVLLANSEGLWWANPLDRAEVQTSVFARAFLHTWLGVEVP